jgi:eukaryotic-like serine/threonine-protein kinase
MNCPACDHVNVDGARYCAKCGALMPVAHVDGNDPMIGTVVGGRYRITGLLGEGGMGRVYTGEQQMGTAVRKVAVKTLLQEFSKDPQVVARFMRECGTVVELEHPNTIKFYDFGQTDSGDLYIAMEFVDGKPLSEIIEREGAMTFERVDKIMKQICGSLHEAHEKGVVHRDLKPENVILTTRAGETDFVKVLDFGIAKRHDQADSKKEQKLTQAGMVLGTPPYMSPEQFTGKELDRRSDIYSLGVMSYEMLTGRLPFDANTPWEWATQHMTQQPFPFEQTGAIAAQIPPPMKSAIMRALSKDPNGRQATAKQFFEELSAGGQRLSAVDVGAPAVGGASTEAFPMAGGGGGGGGAPRAGNTQIGEPFIPPVEAAPPPPMMDVAPPHQNVPTAGGQAVPAPPVRSHGGGGGKGLYIAAAGLLAALLVVGIVVAFGGGGGGGDTDVTLTLPSANTAEPAASTAGTDTGSSDDGNSGDDGTSDTGSTPATSSPPTQPPSPTPNPTSKASAQPQPPSQPPPPPPPANGDAACSQAIQAAQAKNCAAARSALAQCSGSRQGVAAANVNTNCPRRRFLGR